MNGNWNELYIFLFSHFPLISKQGSLISSPIYLFWKFLLSSILYYINLIITISFLLTFKIFTFSFPNYFLKTCYQYFSCLKVPSNLSNFSVNISKVQFISISFAPSVTVPFPSLRTTVLKLSSQVTRDLSQCQRSLSIVTFTDPSEHYWPRVFSWKLFLSLASKPYILFLKCLWPLVFRLSPGTFCFSNRLDVGVHQWYIIDLSSLLFLYATIFTDLQPHGDTLFGFPLL